MALIKLDKKLFSDGRFLELSTKLGCAEKALGAIVRMIMLAQECVHKYDGLIPKAIWNDQRINPALVECNFATLEGDSYQIFDLQSHIAATKRSVSARSKGKSTTVNDRATTVQRSRAVKTSTRYPPDVCKISGGPLTIVGEINFEDQKERSVAKKGRTEQQKELAKKIKNTFADSYFSRYSMQPIWAAKENALVYSLIEKVGHEEALWLAERYPFYNDPWHVSMKHPLEILVKQVQKVRIELRDPRRMLDSVQAKKDLGAGSEKYDQFKEFERARKYDEEQAQKEINNHVRKIE